MIVFHLQNDLVVVGAGVPDRDGEGHGETGILGRSASERSCAERICRVQSCASAGHSSEVPLQLSLGVRVSALIGRQNNRFETYDVLVWSFLKLRHCLEPWTLLIHIGPRNAMPEWFVCTLFSQIVHSGSGMGHPRSLTFGHCWVLRHPSQGVQKGVFEMQIMLSHSHLYLVFPS